MVDTEWLGLAILACTQGSKEDKTGKVEFVATYRTQGQIHELHEHSRFRKYKGQWRYLDGKG